MRPGQFNNKRNRNRNRGRHQGGSNNGGGNPANRVYDSNGPDVKVRGTAQTVAEKYMQLGRDAQSSGDIVMAESYYQHSEHYYRLWLANQPAGQPIQFARRNNEEEFEEDGAPEGAEGEDETVAAEGASQEGYNAPASGEDTAELANADGDGNAPQQSQQRNFRPREQGEREGGRDRFRSRWNRRERNNDQPREGAPRHRDGNGDLAAERAAPERAERIERSSEPAADDPSANWEAPSFLTRPMPAAPIDGGEAEAAPAERRPRGRKPRREAEEAGPPTDVPVPDVQD